VLIVDARRFDEYQTMSIPGGISVPGGELALRIDGLVDSPQTPIVVNCAGRTRSIIGAQSLINAGVSNPVYALRNGTIGWTLAGRGIAGFDRASSAGQPAGGKSRSGGYRPGHAPALAAADRPHHLSF
jgi:rhodanese-related sulfurtransferase